MELGELDRGMVFNAGEGDLAVAAGSRCAVTDAGEVLCTFMTQPALGVNGFVPHLARSGDGGRTWSAPSPLFPDLRGRWSIFGSISRVGWAESARPTGDDARGRGGALYFFGSRTSIDQPGESFWQESNQGLKANELIWSRSNDGGRTWTDPAVIPMPIPGAAEAPGAMCVTSKGAWICCYAPYNTFDAGLKVQRNQVMSLRSEDQGTTWTGAPMLRFPHDDSGAAEAWVVELSDGRLVGVAWHNNTRTGEDYSNPFAISHDQGRTWTPTRETGVMGQSTALAPTADGRVWFIYNQRKHGDPGIRLALAKPTDDAFNIEHDQYAWKAATATQHESSGEHTQWQDFAFGEPSVTVLPDGTLLVTYWCQQPDARGIGCVKLKTS